MDPQDVISNLLSMRRNAPTTSEESPPKKTARRSSRSTTRAKTQLADLNAQRATQRSKNKELNTKTFNQKDQHESASTIKVPASRKRARAKTKAQPSNKGVKTKAKSTNKTNTKKRKTERKSRTIKPEELEPEIETLSELTQLEPEPEPEPDEPGPLGTRIKFRVIAAREIRNPPEVKPILSFVF